jgi:LemA protein
MFLIFIGLVVALFIYGVMLYNRLAALKNRTENAYSQIDVQLKRRYDLIPNLVEVAKTYMAHEKDTLEAVISARAKATAISSSMSMLAADSVMQADAGVTSALGRLMAVAESYPELKADSTMLSLQEQLSSTENMVAASRQHYNDAAMIYNTAQEQFPSSVVAGFANHRRVPMLEVIDSPEERKAPKVTFK